jgi:serpin B
MRPQFVAGIVAVLVAAGCADGVDSARTNPESAAPPGPTSTAASPAGQVGVALPAGSVRSAAVAEAPVAELVTGFNDAGFDLLRRQPPPENVVFSPASIGHALLMAEAAADQRTRAAIQTAFALPANAHDAWNRIDQDLAASQPATLTIADRIWPSLETRPDQAWIDLLASRHGADVVPLNFGGDPDGSRDLINAWVSEHTRQLIPELVADGAISAATVLMLTDAVYFEADWARPFGKYGPVDGMFTTLDGTQVPTSFMRELELTDRRGSGDGFVGAELPYAGDEYSMLVLVPDHGRYEELLGRLDQSLLDEIDRTFTTGPYELRLPKWDIDHRIDLIPWLQELGIAPGSFPSIHPDAFLGGAVHAADITVDEYGTVAAAATGLTFLVSGAPEPNVTVTADKPFIYLIRHRPTGLVLFTGHITTTG